MSAESDRLRELLRGLQEPQGYFFNADAALVTDLIEGLLANKARYGYATCPCRLASGERERDRDIVCPCAYRAADVAEFGSCYCALYVTPAWNAGAIPHRLVPERRPAAQVR